jgi:multicomponent Na+:H+ antiporter subunit F
MQPDVLVNTAVFMICAAFFVALIRVVWGPTLPDRVVAVDLIGISAVCLMVIAAAGRKEPALLDAAVVITLLSFLGTVAYARYAERKTRD